MWDFIQKYMKSFKTSYIFDEQNKYTYEQLQNIVISYGNELKTTLPSGIKCAILCDSGLNTMIALLSCWYADMIPIPMSKHYGESHCKSIIEVIDPDIIITNNIENQLQNDFVDNIKEQCFKVKMLDIKIESELSGVSLIMCTSGTTGKPKGAMITAKGLQKNINSIINYFHLSRTDTIMISRPIYHCAVLTGELLTALCSGTNIVFFDKKYNPKSVLNFTIKKDVSVLCGTPSLLNHLSCFIQKYNIQSGVQKIAISGECLNKTTAVNIRKGFPNTEIYHVYGLTEASPRVSYLPAEKFATIPESVGIPLEGIRIKVIDDMQNECTADKCGQIIVKTPCIMKGYYKNKEPIRQIIRNGWLYTGDIGYKDENGYLYIVSRIDDMIIKGGMNIYPAEIENNVLKIKKISECLAYGIKSDTGQVIAIDIVFADGLEAISKKELMILLSDVLPVYQMPSEVNIVNFIKRNASGKIVRRNKESEANEI